MKVKWKPVKGYEGLYEVSNKGQVRTLKRVWNSGPEHRIARQIQPKIKAAKPDRNGYVRLTLSKKGIKSRKSVHTLVLEAFVGPAPEGYECRHLDGNKENNCQENLCWGTPQENAADRKKHGTQTGGKAGVRRVGRVSRKFTPEQWGKVEDLFKEFDAETKEKYAKHIEKTYGIDIEEFERLKEKQNNRCAVCDRETKLCIDHDHSSGKVRGLLCNSCNSGIGFLGDDDAGVKKALDYLKAADTGMRVLPSHPSSKAHAEPEKVLKRRRK
jgi:hypothetical protein